MINKKVLVYINVSNQLKNCLPWINWKCLTLAMCIEERGWVRAKILLTNWKYIKKSRLIGKIYKYTSSVFNFPFEIVIYHPILSNYCNNVFHLVFSSSCCFWRGATIYCIVYTRHNQLKTDNYQNNKI